MTDFAYLARDYIEKHPYIKEGLKGGVVNYSSLARQILDEAGIVGRGFHAVKIACMRIAQGFSEDYKQGDENKSRGRGGFVNAQEFLRESKIWVNNKRFVIHLDMDYYKLMDILKDFEAEVFYGGVLTLVGDMKDINEIKERIGIWRVCKEDVVEICFRNNEDIEDVPGILSYLYGVFGEHGINIYESWSCYTDTRIIINRNDVEKLVGVLAW